MLRDWGFEPVVLAAILTAVIALGLSIVMGCLIGIFRIWRRRAERLDKQFIGEWEPVLFVAMDGPIAVRLPPLKRRDLAVLLELWTHLQEATRGLVSENLNNFLAKNIPAERILSMAENGGIRHRLVAITALGHLRCRDAIEPLAAMIADPQPVLSYAALRALLRIDAALLLPRVLPILLARSDWPISRLSAIFRELGANTITDPLLANPIDSAKKVVLRLLPLLALCHQERVEPVIRSWIIQQRDPEVVTAALDFLRAPQDIPVLLSAARHDDWRVRAAAASGLGEVGGDYELPTIIELLSDSSWWVRYRAAKALTSQYGVGSPKLGELLRNTEDKFAREMLQQVMAENE